VRRRSRKRPVHLTKGDASSTPLESAGEATCGGANATSAPRTVDRVSIGSNIGFVMMNRNEAARDGKSVERLTDLVRSVTR
jgi:hypothetical protein